MSYPSAEIADWLRLSFEPDVGPVLAGKLLGAFGSPGALYATPHDTLAANLPAALAANLPAALAARIASPPSAETAGWIAHALAWADKPGHHLLTLADAAYPAMLRETADPPVLLYVLGAVAALSMPTIAIVGARHATPGGSQTAHEFACALAARGWCIASGLALGIDAAAHRGALAPPDGTTVAVIGTGADLVYPARNRALAHQIALGGAIVSELPLGTPAAAHHFPRRNRLVAGLSRGVLVVEAAVHSGSLITARLAADIGREVFAIPGSIHSPLSRGCHALIRQGAKLVETAQDVLDELAMQSTGAPAPDYEVAQRMFAGFAAMEVGAPTGRDATGENDAVCDRPVPEGPGVPPGRELLPDPSEQPPSGDRLRNAPPSRQSAPDDPLLALLGFDPLNVDEVQRRSGLTADALQGRLLVLELSGRIARLPGARIQQLRR